MSNQTETNNNPPGIFRKIMNFWNGLNNFIKSLTGVIAAILLLISQWGNIKDMIYPTVSEETIKNIGILNTLSPDKRENVFNDCLKHKTQCLKDILKECETLTREDVAFEESINFINKLNKQLGNDDVFIKCKESANEFAEQSDQLAKANDIELGFNFYIVVLKLFEATHHDEVKLIFEKFIEKINSNRYLEEITKKVLLNKID